MQKEQPTPICVGGPGLKRQLFKWNILQTPFSFIGKTRF